MSGPKGLQGKSLYRVMDICCGLVRPSKDILNTEQSTQTLTNEQAFMMYGYDAGVLGGVQSTEPFLKAMGVRLPL